LTSCSTVTSWRRCYRTRRMLQIRVSLLSAGHSSERTERRICPLQICESRKKKTNIKAL